MPKTPRVQPSTSITSSRANRLSKFLHLLSAGTKTRNSLMKKLRVDLRGFYRDVKFLRGIGIAIEATGDSYSMSMSLEEALDLLPFPDPGLSLREVMQLCQGRTEAHRKLKSRIDHFLGQSPN